MKRRASSKLLALAASSPISFILAMVILAAALFGGGSQSSCASQSQSGDSDLSESAGGSARQPTPAGSRSGLDDVIGLTEADAEAWFGGRNMCPGQAYGQCVWWACMRTRRLGLPHPQSVWGNGADVVANAVHFNGWQSTTQPVPGALLSIPRGLYGQSPQYGHVAVVEKVDSDRGIVVTSEKGSGQRTWSMTYDVKRALADGVTFANPPASSAPSADDGQSDGSQDGQPSGATPECPADGSPSVQPAVDADANGWHATPQQAKAIAEGAVRVRWPSDADRQFQCLAQMWTKESDWQWNADNPTSSAYGIPQALPGSRMSSAGDDWKDNAATQISWGLHYISTRYGTPCDAWSIWQRQHWY